ncbi:heme lyase CcmF/NrfE family subunit [Desulfocurvibacter africanus]|uniref:heme lyase CcmF/NrfE family subunit n=1 Tax=Desulfocurvibacter africanus TaxID=873 RepID=UPI00042757D3|nr:cytochrome c-type biogenesis CcmF C-terminal domain-containing protein [Desulfocurvibacter africanus]
MPLVAQGSLLLALLFTLGLGAWACWTAYGRQDETRLLEKGHLIVTLLMLCASTILLMALAGRDYSYKYVHDYVDNHLALFYRLTAFWAGQEGSLLFWALCSALLGVAFARSASYKSLAGATRQNYWVLFLAVQAFFLLLLTSWSNPFQEFLQAPADGNGLNPLLRNLGMIFHPPLLFLGYAGFTIPACLALASVMAGERLPWTRLCRNWTILSWIFLTAGIVLGGWWAYMELGWGGYWAWDPVENASLIPWLTATAFLHTAALGGRSGALPRTNLLLIGITFLLCIFGTYLVRSGVVNSLHAFGDGGVGLPLLVFMLAGLVVLFVGMAYGCRKAGRPLGEFLSIKGALLCAAWILCALGLVVILGTMWPVITAKLTGTSIGLDAGFYNRVCLPLFSALVLLFALAPWLHSQRGFRDRRGLVVAGLVFIASAILLAAVGIRIPLALVTAAGSLAVLAGILLVLIRRRDARSGRSLATYGVHLGFALMALGVAISGPYQNMRETSLALGESMEVGKYTITNEGVSQSSDQAIAVATARLRVEHQGREVGILSPERRIYANFRQPFAEVSVIPGLLDEIYGVLLGFDESGKVTLKVSVNPLVNWIWIGGTVMCLAGFGLLRRPGSRSADGQAVRANEGGE